MSRYDLFGGSLCHFFNSPPGMFVVSVLAGLIAFGVGAMLAALKGGKKP